MGNALAIVQKLDNPMVFCKEMALAAAGLCGCRNEEEGAAVNMVCLMRGIDYIEFQETYHMIKGKPSKRSDRMLVEFRARGGKYTIEERSCDRAAITMEYDGNVLSTEYTWEQAQQDRWPWKDHRNHDEGLKDNWSTPSDRKAMLWARLVSDTTKAICPEVAAGVYTPEEVMDMEPGPVPEKRNANKSAAEVAAEGVVVSATVVDDKPVKEPESTAEAKVEVDTQDTEVQDRLKSMFSELGIPHEEQVKALNKRGVNSVRSLRDDQCNEIIANLERLKERRAQQGN